MHTVRAGTGERVRGMVVLAIVSGLVAMLLGVAASTARADETMKYTLDRGVIQLNTTTWAKVVDPDIGDPPSTLYATLTDGGAISAAATDFTFPPKKITGLQTGQAALPAVDAKIEIGAAGPISGTFDRVSGSSAVTIPAQALITVYAAGSPASVAKCKVNGFTLNFATTGSVSDPGDPMASPPRPTPNTYAGAPFAPPGNVGAVLAQWTGLPASTYQNTGLAGIVCPAVDGLIGGPGALWLSGTASAGVPPPPPTAPIKEPSIDSSPPPTTTVTDASIAFVAGLGESQQVTGFECQLDGGAWAACTSPQKYTGLAVGKHTVAIQAVNAQGAGPAATTGWEITKTVGPPPPPPGQKPGKFGAVKVSLKPKSVKHGKKATATVTVSNVGTGPATGVKLCLTVSKKQAKGAKCFKVASLAAGKSVSKKFSITVSKKLKRGKKVALSFKATATRIGAKTAKATIKVK